MRDKKTIRRRRAILSRLSVPGAQMKKGKLIIRPDGFYRLRRGKLVRIPDEWVGRPVALFQPTRRYAKFRLSCVRPSKMGIPAKLRRRHGYKDFGREPREKMERSAKRYGTNEVGNPNSPQRKMGHPRNRSDRHVSRRERRDRDREDGLC